MKIVIAGDLAPREKTEELYEKGDVAALFGDILPVLRSADIAIVNLECPLTYAKDRLKKEGPSYRASPRTANTLRLAGFTHVALANNHIKDYLTTGIKDTISACQKADLITVGAGHNIHDITSCVYCNTDDTSAGFYAIAENEFSCATEVDGGANTFTEYNTYHDIMTCALSCDYLIVLYHGGLEGFPYPTPVLQQRCRNMIRCGAKLVICQHSHCIGAYETYQGGTILYGQGNFNFGTSNNESAFSDSLLISLCIGKTGIDMEWIPVHTHSGHTRRHTNSDSVLQALEKRSDEVRNNRVMELYNKEIHQRKAQYIAWLLAFRRPFEIVNRLTGNLLGKLIYSSKMQRRVLNLIRCEIHREVLLSVLQDKKELSQ